MALGIELIIAFILIAIILSSILAPLESLTWWAGWFGDKKELHSLDTSEKKASEAPAQDRTPAAAYLVYLTGIGGFSQNSFLPQEQHLLEKLSERSKEIRVVDDIYPYSVTNNGLIDHRLFAWFWNWVLRQKEQGRPFGFMINIRNLMQVLVAADNRYGPLYAHGIAQVVFDRLLAHGYEVGSGTPIYLLGYSGGGEMSISAVGPLAQSTGAPVSVISLGGVVSSDPNFEVVTHFYHLYGDKDRIHIMGPILFPGRWSWLRSTPWNRAKRAGKITYVRLGEMGHTGPGGYLDVTRTVNDGTTYLDATVAAIHTIVSSSPPRSPVHGS